MPEVAYHVKWGGRTERVAGRARAAFGSAGCRPAKCRGTAYDTPIAGYRVNTCNTLRLWKSEAVKSFDFDAFNRRRLLPGGGGEGGLGDHHEGALPERRARRRQAASPRAAVFLRLLLAPGHAAAARPRRRHAADLPREVRRSAQRHASVHRRRRADAAPRRRARDSLGRGVEHHRADVRLHQPHAPARGAREVAGAACSSRRCRATSRSSTRSTAGSSTRCGRSSRPTRRRVRRMSLIDEGGERHVRMAHLAVRRQPRGQRRGRTAHRAAEDRRAARLPRVWPGEIHNKTNGVTPRRFVVLANPGLTRLISRTIGDGVDSRPARAAVPRAACRRPRVPVGVAARSSGPTSRISPDVLEARTGVVLDPDALFDVQVKRFHEYKRQHLNVLHIVTLYNRLKRSRATRPAAARVHLRRQGGAGLPDGEAHHPADQRRRRGRQRRPGRAGRLKVAFFPDFNVKNAQLRLSGRGPLRADLNGGQGGVRHGQHEARPQRRPHDRDARRREHRDPGGDRRRRTSSSSA